MLYFKEFTYFKHVISQNTYLNSEEKKGMLYFNEFTYFKHVISQKTYSNSEEKKWHAVF